MRKATSSSLALRPEVLPCTLQILSYDRHPVLGYITRLAFAYERTLTSKLMILHGTQQKCRILSPARVLWTSSLGPTRAFRFHLFSRDIPSGAKRSGHFRSARDSCAEAEDRTCPSAESWR